MHCSFWVEKPLSHLLDLLCNARLPSGTRRPPCTSLKRCTYMCTRLKDVTQRLVMVYHLIRRYAIQVILGYLLKHYTKKEKCFIIQNRFYKLLPSATVYIPLEEYSFKILKISFPETAFMRRARRPNLPEDVFKRIAS